MTLQRADRHTAAAAALIAFGAFAMTVGFAFVYDDVHIIETKTVLHSLANWREILTTTWWEYALYRPLTELSFALDWALSGGNPGWFHLVNVLLHATAAALVFLLARGGLGVLGAGAAALLFAVHPVHVEAVANVVGRAELLATVLVLAAAIGYRVDGDLAARQDRSWRRGLTSLGVLAALGLALASKETAFAAPGVFLLIDWFDGRRRDERLGTRFRRHWVLWAGSVALSLEWLWVRSLVLGDLAGDHPAPGIEGESLPGRALVMAPVVLEYLRLLFWPARLSADYSPDFLPAVAQWSLRAAAGFAALGAAVIFALRARRRAPMVTFGLAWIGGTLLIVSNVIVPTGTLLAERTLYLPSVGAVLIAGWLLAWAEARWRHAGVAVTAVLCGLGLARTVTRTQVWRDNSRFFPQLVRDAPTSYRAWWVAGSLAYDAGNRQRGEAMVRRAILIYPLHPAIWETLGYRLEEDQRWHEAAQHFQAAFRLDSMRLEAGLRAGIAYLRAGFPDSAELVARRMSDVAPRNVRTYSLRGELAATEGRWLEAMTWRRRAAWVAPDTWGYWAVTAEAALAARYCWEARRSLHRVRELRPEFPRLAAMEQRLEETGCAR